MTVGCVVRVAWIRSPTDERSASTPPSVRSGLAYDPKADRWSAIPAAPLPSRLVPTAVWTGRSLLVWGGVSTKTWGKFLAAGAVFTPTTP